MILNCLKKGLVFKEILFNLWKFILPYKEIENLKVEALGQTD